MGLLQGMDVVARELALFAGVGLLIGGLDDLLVDLGYFALRAVGPRRRLTVADLPSAAPRRFALLIPAWGEEEVIGAMLAAALARLRGADYRIFVGCYPNDPATIAAVRAVREPRIELVIGPRPGPTTKADNLNALWRAIAAGGWRPDAIVLHDAEDVLHPDELVVFGALLAAHDVVQLPVLPIVARGSPLLSGHYADEFAESHTRSLVVRSAIGAALPLAGTGFAVDAGLLARVAATRGGDPFDAASLTEDYELGLHLAGQGARGCFARVFEQAGGPLVAVRAIFPCELGAAVRQKARWMTGIALAGWDRTGWARGRALGDHWMRLRDRRAPLAMLVLAAAYGAMLAWSVAGIGHWMTGAPAPRLSATLATMLLVNSALLVWRLAMRALFTGRAYGWREAIVSPVRFLVGNAVDLMAAPRALVAYLRLLRGHPPVWHKTAHQFPDLADA
ncbi:glycosyl transferase family protein [uncultured Sphingomonas sp.]|uniref:glycosyl transferase family protein n=1 Tax=uncultured Sphingomonas sp. TaxID=158754 RepID=UPI0035CC86ED